MVAEAVQTDVVLIKELMRDYVETIKDGDMEGWLSLWVPEGKQMAAGAPARMGREAIREGNRPLLELFTTVLRIHPDELRILGDHAYTHGNYDYAMTPKEGGEAITGSGKFLTILQKQEDGEWKFAIDCFNDNAPPEAL